MGNRRPGPLGFTARSFSDYLAWGIRDVCGKFEHINPVLAGECLDALEFLNNTRGLRPRGIKRELFRKYPEAARMAGL